MGTQPRKGFVRVEPHKQVPGTGQVVPANAAPSLEQCENVALLLGFPILPEGLQPPYYLESMRNLHALAVRMLNGDEEAERSLNALLAMFGRPKGAS